MRTGPRLVVAATSGAALGLLWTAAYAPVAHPPLLAALSHAALALVIERAQALVRLRGGAALGAGLLVGLVAVPAWMQILLEAGVVGGKVGALLLGAAILIGGLLGGGLGALLGAGARRAALGALALLGLGLGLWASAGALGGEVVEEHEQPKAASATSWFPTQKVAVIGIDGADWSVIRPMMDAGRMPHLAGLVARGQEGVLRSIEPTYSPVVWNTIFSGQPPEVHGLADWYRSDARSRRVPLLWDIYGAHGRSSLTLNVPGTWPPAEVDNGVLFAGFPIPSLTTGDQGQLLGTVVSTEDEDGPVPTSRARALGGGRFSLDPHIAAPDIAPRLPRFSNAVLDQAVRKQLITLRGARLAVEATLVAGADRPTVRLEGATLREPVEIAVGAWSPWMRVRDGALEAVMRAYVLEADQDRLRLFLTPAYQAPWAPRFPFATGVSPEELASGDPYVVEALGWKAHRDRRVTAIVPAALADVEHSHVAMAERMLARDPDLFSFVITITDRVQHPFWPLHAKHDYEGRLEPAPGMQDATPVEDAYALADASLGRLLARLSPEALVLVVSDHGFTSTDAKVEGEHRLEGIWVAAGPMVPPSEQERELSVMDVVPTILRCVGAPLALDLAGEAHAELCPSVPAGAEVASYRRGEDAGAHDALIDESREAQLKAMGYIDDEAPEGGK